MSETVISPVVCGWLRSSPCPPDTATVAQKRPAKKYGRYRRSQSSRTSAIDLPLVRPITAVTNAELHT